MPKTNNQNQTCQTEAKRLAIYERGQGFELGTTVNKSS